MNEEISSDGVVVKTFFCVLYLYYLDRKKEKIESGLVEEINDPWCRFGKGLQNLKPSLFPLYR